VDFLLSLKKNTKILSIWRNFWRWKKREHLVDSKRNGTNSEDKQTEKWKSVRFLAWTDSNQPTDGIIKNKLKTGYKNKAKSGIKLWTHLRLIFFCWKLWWNQGDNYLAIWFQILFHPYCINLFVEHMSIMFRKSTALFWSYYGSVATLLQWKRKQDPWHLYQP